MCLKCVLNVEAIVATFNPEKALEGAFSVITNLHVDLCFQIYLGVTPIDFFFIGVSYWVPSLASYLGRKQLLLGRYFWCSAQIMKEYQINILSVLSLVAFVLSLFTTYWLAQASLHYVSTTNNFLGQFHGSISWAALLREAAAWAGAASPSSEVGRVGRCQSSLCPALGMVGSTGIRGEGG